MLDVQWHRDAPNHWPIRGRKAGDSGSPTNPRALTRYAGGRAQPEGESQWDGPALPDLSSTAALRSPAGPAGLPAFLKQQHVLPCLCVCFLEHSSPRHLRGLLPPFTQVSSQRSSCLSTLAKVPSAHAHCLCIWHPLRPPVLTRSHCLAPSWSALTCLRAGDLSCQLEHKGTFPQDPRGRHLVHSRSLMEAVAPAQSSLWAGRG